MIMLLDGGDAEILRLAGRYRWLPCAGLGKYGFCGLETEIEKLARLRLLTKARSGEYLRLTAEGYALLEQAGYSYKPGGKRAWAGSPALRRRLQTAEVMLTCLRAGIDTLQEDVKALREQPVFYPAFDLRPAMMNCASCIGFGHWGGAAYMIQYIAPDSPGMYRVNEFSVFHNLASVFGGRRDTPMALLIFGESYAAAYKQLTGTAPSARHGVKGFADFRDVYDKTDMPVHIAACGEAGARQLAVMRQPDYRARIARAAYGQRWQTRDAQIFEADGCVDGSPLVIAADMDLRRLDTVVAAAKALGRPLVRAAAFDVQLREVLHPLYGNDGMVSLLKIEDAVLDAAFSPIRLYDMGGRGEGTVIHA
jgi:hypothetical protein